MHGTYYEVGRQEGVEWVGSKTQTVSDRNSLNLQDRPRQLDDTTHTLINAIHWLYRPNSAPSWFDRVNKKPSVEAMC